MSWMKRIGGRLPDFEEVVRRFPVTVAIMAAFTVWIIADNHFNLVSYRDKEFVYSGFILAGYVSVIVKLIVEARKGSALLGGIVGLLLGVIAFGLCYFSKALDFNVYMAIAIPVLFLGNAAAWRMGRQDRNVWNFTQKLWTGALFAAVGSVIFLLGMLAISEAVRALFGVNLNDLTMETILPVGLAFLAPVYWLGTLPRYGEAEDVTELSFEARALSFLGTWMLAPLVIIYALIVLAYGVKVLVQWDLPKGEIAQLVSPFIGVGMLVWLMLEPKVLKESGFVRFYRAAWHWVMLPAAVLLGVGVFARIHEYGFTPIRVFLAFVVTWAVVQSLWFTLMPKAKRDIRIPTALAAGLLTVGAFAAGPISMNSQFHRGKVAQDKFESLDTADIKNNLNAAKQYRGSLEYFISKNDERRFKSFLPDQDMPNSIYGPDWKTILKGLHLNDLDNDNIPYRTPYNYQLTSPISIPENSQFYGVYKIKRQSEKWITDGVDSDASEVGNQITFDLDGNIVTVDFNEIIQSMKFIGGDDEDNPIQTLPINIKATNGKNLQLVILQGYVAVFRESERQNGNLEIAFIVPN